MEPTFDGCADRYEEELAAGLSVTGDGMDYYARERLRWVRRLVERDHVEVTRVLDFGCGVGRATPHLFDTLGARDVVGVDISTRSLERAREQYGSEHARFVSPGEIQGTFDLAFTNGVFHHIPPAQREAGVRFIYDALRPGGVFAFWENNPWNPGTRYIMSRVSFDEDAITLPPPEARGLLRAGGFQVLGTTSRFYFPRSLAMLRWLEGPLASIPLGGQYLVWCRRAS